MRRLVRFCSTRRILFSAAFAVGSVLACEPIAAQESIPGRVGPAAETAVVIIDSVGNHTLVRVGRDQVETLLATARVVIPLRSDSVSTNGELARSCAATPGCSTGADTNAKVVARRCGLTRTEIGAAIAGSLLRGLLIP